MMKKLLAAAFVAFLAFAPALAQNAGTVTNHAFAVGKGPNVQGYTSLLCGSAQLAVGQVAADPICRTIAGDLTLNAVGSTTLATVNPNVGTFGSATQCITTTQNAKGLTTAISAANCTPAIGSITGLGTGVAAALAINTGSNGAFAILGNAANFTNITAAGTFSGVLSGNAQYNALNLVNTDPGASASVVSVFGQSNAGSLLAASLSTAGGGNSLLEWTGTGGFAIANLNAAGNLALQTGAGPTNALYVTPTQSVVVSKSVFTPVSGTPLTVSKNTVTVPTNNTGEPPTVQIVAADNTVGSLQLSTFGTSGGSTIRLSQAGGTAASPTATAVSQFLGAFTANGFYTSGGPAYASGAGFVISSTENWTSTTTGTRVDLYAAPTGSTLTIAASIAGGVSIGDTVDPGAGSLTATAAIKSKGATQGVGYATGAGGTITQITSRATGVTLSKVAGDITLLAAVNAATSAATAVTITVTNTTVAATDNIVINQKSGTDKYMIFVTNVAAGSFQITWFTTGGVTNESPVFHFSVIKSVNS